MKKFLEAMEQGWSCFRGRHEWGPWKIMITDNPEVCEVATFLNGINHLARIETLRIAHEMPFRDRSEEAQQLGEIEAGHAEALASVGSVGILTRTCRCCSHEEDVVGTFTKGEAGAKKLRAFLHEHVPKLA